MPAPATVDRSALRLSEVARHVVIPEGIVDTLWFEVADRCAEFGDTFDAWQDGLGQVTLGLREDGMFAATVGGVTYSIPRQVAKTFLVGRICIALCTLFPGTTILWTAHRTRTTTKTFQNFKGVVMRPAVRGFLRAGSNNGTAIRDANGEQEIPFANGSTILFGAREQGFGRGFDEIDVEVFDEAQILTDRALEDMVAATNQSRFKHGALLFYMGTPPRPVDPGAVFEDRRAEALRAKRDAKGVDFGAIVEAGDSLYVECSADANVGKPGGPSLDDPHQIEKANPSYPHRTPPVSVKRLRKNLRGDDGWRREGLGVWDVLQTVKVAGVNPADWAKCGDSTSHRDGSIALGITQSPDRSTVSIAILGKRADGDYHGELIEHRVASTSWVPRRVRELVEKHQPLSVMVDPIASGLIRDLEDGGVSVDVVTASAYIAGCGRIYDMVHATAHPDEPAGEPEEDAEAQPLRRLWHRDQPVLNDAVKSAVMHKLARGFVWRPGGDESVEPLVALTLALIGFEGNDVDYDVMDSIG